MLVQLDLDERHCIAYDIIARSHRKSRRQYITDMLIEAAEKVPGLMDKVKSEMYGGTIDQSVEVSFGTPKNVLLDSKPIRKKKYRFVKFTGEVFEGVGEVVGDALLAATGRRYTAEEYEEEFRTPEFLGYEE